MSDAKRFEGMTAVVTGGASGIGLGVGKRIAAEGGRVTIWDQDPARLKAAVAEVGAQYARSDEVDVTDPSAVERATLTAAGEMGHIDILVCSAGVAGKNALVIDYPIDESIFFGSTTRVASKRAVLVAPGLTALMRTPSVRTVAARQRV